MSDSLFAWSVAPRRRATVAGLIGDASSGTLDLSKGITAQGAGTYLFQQSGIVDQLPSGSSDLASALVDLASNWNNLSTLTPQQQAALSVHVVSAAVELVPIVGWILAGLLEGEWALAQALMGDQGSKCGTDQSKPYGGYDASTFSYQAWGGSFTPAPAGTFESFAQTLLVNDFNANNTCWVDARLRMPLIFALALAAWNTAHDASGSPQMETVGSFTFPIPNSGGTRTLGYEINSPWSPTGTLLMQTNPNFGFPGSTDPINAALNIIAGVGHTNLAPFGMHEDPNAVPQPAIVSFTVNNGPARVVATPTPTPTPTPAPSGSSGSGGAVVAVLGLVAAVLGAGWFAMGQPTSLDALKKAWKSGSSHDDDD